MTVPVETIASVGKLFLAAQECVDGVPPDDVPLEHKRVVPFVDLAGDVSNRGMVFSEAKGSLATKAHSTLVNLADIVAAAEIFICCARCCGANGRGVADVVANQFVYASLHSFGPDHASGPGEVAPEGDQDRRPVHRKRASEEDMLEDCKDHADGERMSVVQTHGWDSLAIYRSGERGQHSHERKNTKDCAHRGWLRERGTIGDNRTVATDLALCTIRKNAKDGLAFEIGNRKGDGRNVGNVLLIDGDDTTGRDRDAAIDWTKTARVRVVAYDTRCSADLPCNIGVAGIECEIKSALSISENPDVHHQSLVVEVRVPGQVELDGHVVFIIGGIKSGDVDETVAHAVSEISSVQRRTPVVRKVFCLSILVDVRDIARLLGKRRAQTCQQGKQGQHRWP